MHEPFVVLNNDLIPWHCYKFPNDYGAIVTKYQFEKHDRIWVVMWTGEDVNIAGNGYVIIKDLPPNLGFKNKDRAGPEKLPIFLDKIANLPHRTLSECDDAWCEDWSDNSGG